MSKPKKFIISIPYELLYQLYVTQHLTTKTIADQLHCSQSTIFQRLREYEIPFHSRTPNIPKEELTQLYESGASIKAIAQHFHVSPRTIYSRLHKWHLKEPRPSSSLTTLPISYILESYDRGSSAAMIGRELQVAPSTIIHVLQRHGIPLRNSMKRIDLPIDDICQLYTQHKLSTIHIGKLYSVKPSTIASRLRERGIILRGNKEQLPTYAIISDYMQGTSLQQLATTYQTKYHTIRNLLIRHGVYRKTRRIREHTYAIQNLHKREQLSVAEIASHYGCHPETIRRIIKDTRPQEISPNTH